MQKQHEDARDRDHAHQTRLAIHQHQPETENPEIRTNNLPRGRMVRPHFFA